MLLLATAAVLAPSHVNPHSTGAAVTITQGADLHLAYSGWTAPDVAPSGSVQAPDGERWEATPDVSDEPSAASVAASGCRGPPA